MTRSKLGYLVLTAEECWRLHHDEHEIVAEVRAEIERLARVYENDIELDHRLVALAEIARTRGWTEATRRRVARQCESHVIHAERRGRDWYLDPSDPSLPS